MAWWRERLEDLDKGAQAPAEPRLQAVANELLARGISGLELSRLEDAWLPLLEPCPWAAPQVEALRLRGRVLFGIGAQLLGGTPEGGETAGAMWSLVDGAQHCTDLQSRQTLFAEARAIGAQRPKPISGRLRPLTILGALAAIDATGGGNAARVAAALKHRLTGRLG